METKNNNIQQDEMLQNDTIQDTAKQDNTLAKQDNTLAKQAAKLRRQRTQRIVASVFGIAVLIYGIVKTTMIFMDYHHTETSNDAQIEQYISPVNLRASGYIKEVRFTEHQSVKKGDTLLILDDREYRIRVMEAEAALKDAMAGASVLGQTLNTTQASASVYKSSIAEVEIRLTKLEKDRERYRNLVARNAATPIQLEQIETEYEATKKQLDGLLSQQKAAISGIGEVSTRRRSTEPPSNGRALHSKWRVSTSLIRLSPLHATASLAAARWRRDSTSRQDRRLRTSCPTHRNGS